MINIDNYGAPHNKQHRFNHTHACSKIQGWVCVFKKCNWWPEGLHPLPQISRSHCVMVIVYCITVGSTLKKFENVCSLLFIPWFLILFGLTKALYSTMVKAVKRDNCKRGHSVWELISCIGRKDCVLAYMRTHVPVCPCVCVHTHD